MKHRVRLCGTLMLGTIAAHASANESFVNFWRPGQLGSMAAVPGAPGWTLPIAHLHLSVGAKDTRELAAGTRLDTDLQGRTNMLFFVPTYTFESLLWGGRPSIGLGIGAGHTRTTAEATLSLPGGHTFSGVEREARTGLADIYPTANVKWSAGAHNYLTYVSGVLPVGAYHQSRLANIGENRWAVDAGGGYTYLDMQRRMEFSVVGGLNYKARNPATDYRSGAEGHIDWTTSYFLLPHLHAGLAGYFYRQLRDDSGSGARAGDFRSRVNGIGPQASLYFEVGGRIYYLNAKAFHEWGAKNRGEGWNFWLTLAMPLTGS